MPPGVRMVKSAKEDTEGLAGRKAEGDDTGRRRPGVPRGARSRPRTLTGEAPAVHR